MKIFFETPQITAIINNDYSTFQALNGFDKKKIFTSKSEFCEYARRLNISKILGLDEKTDCIFHDDTTKSAGIYYQGIECLYTCHSANCNLKCENEVHTTNIFGIIENIFDCNNITAIKILTDLLNCEINSVSQENIDELINNNYDVLNELMLKSPEFQKIVGCDINVLLALYDIIKNATYDLDKTKYNEIIIGESTRYIANAVGKDIKISKSLAILHYFGLIRRIPLYEIYDKRMERLRMFAKRSATNRLVSQTAIKRLDISMLDNINDAVNRFKKFKYTKKDFNFDTICEREGPFLANELFPQK